MTCEQAIDLLIPALDQALETTRIAALEEHLAECAPCGTYFEQLRLTREALRRLPRAGATSAAARARLIEEYQREFGRRNE
jgi:anti-sigma factor RsiW